MLVNDENDRCGGGGENEEGLDSRSDTLKTGATHGNNDDDG